jgi:hypothetical protein
VSEREGRPWRVLEERPCGSSFFADHLGCIDENKALDPDLEPEKSLLDEFQCPAATRC